MTTQITIKACDHSDVHVTILDMVRVPEGDTPAIEADPINGIEAKAATEAYDMRPSVEVIAAGETKQYVATSSRTIVVSEAPKAPVQVPEEAAPDA